MLILAAFIAGVWIGALLPKLTDGVVWFAIFATIIVSLLSWSVVADHPASITPVMAPMGKAIFPVNKD